MIFDSIKVDTDLLAQSYLLMRQNAQAWNHLMQIMKDVSEGVVRNTIDCKAIEDLTVNDAAYVKGVRDTVNVILKKIEEASRG